MENKNSKSKWDSYGIDGALLFICFQDRIFHPDSYSASEIFRSQELPFSKKYSQRNFGTYCQTAANRCKRFERNGTGLTDQLKESIKKARQKYSHLLSNLKSSDPFVGYHSEEDSNYSDLHASDSDNLSFDKSVDEPSLSSLLQQSTLDIRHSAQGEKPKKNSKHTSTLKSPSKQTLLSQSKMQQIKGGYNSILESQTSMTKHLITVPDGRIFVAKMMPSKWDGHIRLNDDCTEVLEDTEYSVHKFLNAGCFLKAHGCEGTNNVFQNALQSKLSDSLIKRYKNGEFPEPDIIEIKCNETFIVITRRIFKLPFQVEKDFYDANGNVEEAVVIDELDSGEWLSFFLKRKEEVVHKDIKPKVRRRGHHKNGGAGTVRNRNDGDEQNERYEKFLKSLNISQTDSFKDTMADMVEDNSL